MVPYNSNNSPEINEILVRPPSNLIRYASGSIFIILLILIYFSTVIKYPDIIKTQLKFNSLNSQKAVISKVPNKLLKILVADSSIIKKNQIIAYIDCNSNHDSILKLEEEIMKIYNMILKNDIQELFTYELKIFNGIDDVQNQYDQFGLDFDEFKKYQDYKYFSDLEKYTNNELNNIKNIDQNLNEQISILKQDYEISKSDFEIQTKLFNQGVISKSELKVHKSKMLLKELQLKQLESTLFKNVTIINNLKKEKIAFKNNLELSRNKLFSSTISLLNSISDWRLKYLLISPIDGYTIFTSILEEGQLLPQNKELLYIMNGNINEIIGEINIHQSSFGKIRLNQEVIVKIDAFPYEEYGVVYAKVSSISPISVDNKYLIKVKFPNGLSSNFNKKFQYYSGMTAQAEIITKDKSIIERLFQDFYRLIL